MSREYEIRTTQLTVVPKGDPIFSEQATVIEIVDEAAGEFVSIKQHSASGKFAFITPEEWPTIRKAIDKIIDECRIDEET